MKKTLAVAAVLAAFAGSAAADVTVYGKLDLGLGYVNAGDTDSIEMVSGNSAGSRIGVKGSEKIGDMTVGFTYEFGTTADVGTLSTTARISQLYVKGAYGELGFGRYGVLDAATGPYDTVGGLTQAGTGWYDIMDQGYVFATRARMNNAITYKTPSFGGFTVLAQVASGSFETEDEFNSEYTHNADLYYAVAAQYKAGDFGAGLTVSSMKYHQDDASTATVEDEVDGLEDLNVTAGVNYNFGVAKVWLAGNYFESGVPSEKQYGFALSAETPVMGGTLAGMVGYAVASADGEEDAKRTTIGASYKYPLSKQTYLYAAAGWDSEKEGDAKDYTTRAVFGMCHSF